LGISNRWQKNNGSEGASSKPFQFIQIGCGSQIYELEGHTLSPAIIYFTDFPVGCCAAIGTERIMEEKEAEP
jgi:hypothetical protein